MSGIHIYVHVPFCVDTCGYCDFYRGIHREDREKRFVAGLLTEIDLRVPAGSVITSLYFGGGTPSLLAEGSWTAIFERFSARSVFSPEAEISMEANPFTVTRHAQKMWRGLGINRVSVGIQSLNAQILRFLNRIHTPAGALFALEILAAGGWDSISADLIYGIPDQTLQDCADAVNRIGPMVQHLSAYALTIEPATPFGRRRVSLPPGDEIAVQYEMIVDRAGEHGMARYEVSNFSRPGRECVHNRNTWRYGPYIGLGPSAAGFDGRRRYKNVSDLAVYVETLEAKLPPIAEEEIVDDHTGRWDRLMLGLRTREGAELTKEDAEYVRSIFEEAGMAGCLEWTGQRARLESSRLILLDEILSRSALART